MSADADGRGRGACGDAAAGAAGVSPGPVTRASGRAHGVAAARVAATRVAASLVAASGGTSATGDARARAQGRAAGTAGEAHRLMRALPVASLETITGGGTVLVLAPHPDDESLGCGGLIAQLCAAGRPPAVGQPAAGRLPVVVVVTDGAGSHPGSEAWPGPRLAALREAEAVAAVAALGLPAGRVHFLRLPDTRAPTEGEAFAAAASRLAALVRAEGVGTIATAWEHDPHCDHVAAHALARAVADRTGVRLISYPVWGWTLAPETILAGSVMQGWRLDVAAQLAAKRAAIRAHASQHGRVVTDDPGGFVLPEALLAVFEGPFETFLLE